MELIPIWKSTYYETSAGTCEYRILLNSEEEIFRGKAVKSPAEDSIRILLNKICSDYVNSFVAHGYIELATASGSTVAHTNGYVEFKLQTMNDSGVWIDRVEWAFVNDTSYDRDFLGGYSEPINGHAAAGQMLPYTVINDTNSAETICYTII